MSAAPVGCIVLAAGSSRRFGSDKRQHRLPGGKTLLEQTLDNVGQVFEHRVLVLRADDVALALRHGNQWQIVLAVDAELGLGHSLAAALPTAAAWSGAVVALADMAWVQPTSLRAVQQAVQPDTLVVPCHKGQRGNPVGIGSAYFDRLKTPHGDNGARTLFGEFRDKVIRLELDDPGILQDLDTPP